MYLKTDRSHFVGTVRLLQLWMPGNCFVEPLSQIQQPLGVSGVFLEGDGRDALFQKRHGILPSVQAFAELQGS